MKSKLSFIVIFGGALLIGFTIQLGARAFMEIFPNPPLVVEHNYHYNIQDEAFDEELIRYLDTIKENR